MRGHYTLGRIVCWFSCGDASALAAKLTITQNPSFAVDVVYCDTFAYEHPDNRRFFADVQRWLGTDIKVIRSEEYTDIYDVFDKTGWLIGVEGARCTTELKKVPRIAYQRADDIHVFGFTAEEGRRIRRFREENPELLVSYPLYSAGLTKADCHEAMRDAGIELPAMYRLGYRNNNCIGCVKGGLGYWNKIRRDFPEAFARMAAQERKMNVAINKTETRENGKRIRHKVFLDELPEHLGRYEEEPDIQCGVLCIPKESP